jgi:hypothetical protein
VLLGRGSVVPFSWLISEDWLAPKVFCHHVDGHTLHYNKIIRGANFPICKGLRPGQEAKPTQWI